MVSVSFEKVKTLTILSSTNKSTFELALVKWGNNDLKYDLRKWGNDGNTPYKGITFDKNELEKVYRILSRLPDLDENLSIYKKVKVGSIDATIYSILGEFKSNSKMKGYVTFMSWGGSPKLDIRCWNKDFSICSKGVTLSEKEKNILISCLNNEFKDRNEDILFDTSNIDDALFI